MLYSTLHRYKLYRQYIIYMQTVQYTLQKLHVYCTILYYIQHLIGIQKYNT